MGEAGFGYLLAGFGLGMFGLSIIQTVAPGADRKSWVTALGFGAVVLGFYLTG
jgi:hypothetical protein